MNHLRWAAAPVALASAISLTGCGNEEQPNPDYAPELETVIKPVAIELASLAIDLSMDPNSGVKAVDHPDDPDTVIISDIFADTHDDLTDSNFWVEVSRVDGALDPATVSVVQIENDQCSPDEVDCFLLSAISLYAPNTEAHPAGDNDKKDRLWAATESTFVLNERSNGSEKASGYRWSTVDEFVPDANGRPTNPVATAEEIVLGIHNDFEYALHN